MDKVNVHCLYMLWTLTLSIVTYCCQSFSQKLSQREKNDEIYYILYLSDIITQYFRNIKHLWMIPNTSPSINPWGLRQRHGASAAVSGGDVGRWRWRFRKRWEIPGQKLRSVALISIWLFKYLSICIILYLYLSISLRRKHGAGKSPNYMEVLMWKWSTSGGSSSKNILSRVLGIY
jgi:hypothetical protein